MLIGMACPLDLEGHHYARELAREQTLENLVTFSDNIQKYWDRWQSVKADSRKGKHGGGR